MYIIWIHTGPIEYAYTLHQEEVYIYTYVFMFIVAITFNQINQKMKCMKHEQVRDVSTVPVQ